MPLLLVFVLPLVVIGAVFWGPGSTADAAVLRDALRVSGRASFLLFLPALLASPWHQLWPSKLSAYLKRRRRSFGIAFAAVHTVHGLLILRLLTATDYRPTLMVAAFGGGGFLLMYGMFVTSFPAPARWVGAANWARLHRLGLHFIALVFSYDFFYRTVITESRQAYVPFGALLLAGYALRFALGDVDAPMGIGRSELHLSAWLSGRAPWLRR